MSNSINDSIKTKEDLINKTLKRYICNRAMLELEYICKPKGCIRDEIGGFIKQFDMCIEKAEKEIGIPKEILYSVFINKEDILKDEYKSMLKDFNLDDYSPQTFICSIKERNMLRQTLDYMEGR